MAAERNIEENTKKIVDKDLEEGKELQDFQEAQNQLLQIQAAQKENLQVDRAISTSQSQNNQTMAQAAGIMASGVENNNINQISPQTQAILGKYGYGKPKVQTSTEVTSGPVQGRGIIINNKTENKTTNNIQLSPPNIPISSVKKSSDNGMEKFKLWISGAFAKQKEQDNIRERNYQKKEWSLSRSSNKIMNKLEEMGKTLGDRLDPRKVANVFMDQFKVLMFLLGFQFISKNWEKILGTVANIERWLKRTAEYFGINVDLRDGISLRQGRSLFVKDLISFLGGDPEGKDGAFTVLHKLFKSAVDLMGDKLELFFQDRANAVSAIEFPKLSSSDPLEVIKSLGIYLGDILTAIVGGRKGIEQNISNNIKSIGRADAMGANPETSRGWIRNDLRFSDAMGMDNTDAGDLASVTNNKMSEYNYDSNGELSNNTTSSSVQSNSIAGMITDDQTTHVHTVGIMSGLENLNKSAEKYGKTLVTEEFMDALKELIPSLNKDNIPKEHYKFIKVKKTQEDYNDEGANPYLEAGSSFFKRSAINGGKKLIGADTAFGNIVDTAMTGDIVKDPYFQGIVSGAKATMKKASSNDYKLQMIPLKDPRAGLNIQYMDYHTGKLKKGKVFSFYSLTPDSIEAIKNKLSEALNNSNFEFDSTNKSSMESLNKKLIELKKKKLNRDGKNKMGVSYSELRKKGITSDYDSVVGQYSKLNEYDKSHEELERNFENKYKNSQFGEFAGNVSEGVNTIVSNVTDYIENAIPNVEGTELQKNFVNKFRPLYKSELKKRGFDTKYTDVLVAQCGLESGWGKSELSRKYNNYGGIKATRNDPNAIWMSTEEYDPKIGANKSVVEPFKAFKDESDYVRYHVNKLDRTWKAFDGDSINDFINRIIGGRLKYATAKNYGSYLANVVSGIKNKFPEDNTTKSITTTPSSVKAISKSNKKPNTSTTPTLISTTNRLKVPEWRPLSSIQDNSSFDNSGLINYTANQVKDYANNNGDILSELQNISKEIKNQGSSLTILSSSVSDLAVVAASNGNNTTVINNSGGDKKSSPSLTLEPNSWVPKGAFDIA